MTFGQITITLILLIFENYGIMILKLINIRKSIIFKKDF